MRYARADYDQGAWSWHGPYSLTDDNEGWASGWFVNLDVGEVTCEELELDGDRVVAFAYTGVYDATTDYWGYRPLVGYWEPPGDGNHVPDFMIVNPDYPPEQWGSHYYAGWVCVDIPEDNTNNGGAAVVYIQDCEEEWPYGYQIFGISSLNPDFTWISVPSEEEEFDEATFPSLVVHCDGVNAAVTYFARSESSDWVTYATSWDLLYNSIADPTEIDRYASGEFEMDYYDQMLHNWSTASKPAKYDSYTYWAAWSDKMEATEPCEILGSMGFAYEQ